MRAALRVAAIVVLFAAASPAAATDATLGARLSPVNLIIERDNHVSLTNKSTVPVVVTMDAIGDGWALDSNSFPLALGEARTVTITTAGTGDAVIRASLTSAEAANGIDTAALVLETHVRHLTAWERLGATLGVWLYLAAAGLGLLLALAVRRRLGPSRKAER